MGIVFHLQLEPLLAVSWLRIWLFPPSIGQWAWIACWLWLASPPDCPLVLSGVLYIQHREPSMSTQQARFSLPGTLPTGSYKDRKKALAQVLLPDVPVVLAHLHPWRRDAHTGKDLASLPPTLILRWQRSSECQPSLVNNWALWCHLELNILSEVEVNLGPQLSQWWS